MNMVEDLLASDTFEKLYLVLLVVKVQINNFFSFFDLLWLIIFPFRIRLDVELL